MENKKTQAVEVDKTSPKRKSVVREYAEAIFIAFLLAIFIRTFIIQAFKIPSGSMEKTLLIGDHLLVSKFSYGVHVPNEIPFVNIQLFKDIIFFLSVPERYDIIVFKFPRDETTDFIKRVIGLPGEILELKNQKVYINNKLIEDPYARHTAPSGSGGFVQRDNYGPMVIPDGHVFVMGDNRENSKDSRYWGFLDITKIRGKAQMIYWSWDSQASWVRFGRMGKILE